MAEAQALGFWGGLPLPPGVGGNEGWGPPATWDTVQDGLVDENGNPLEPPAEEPPPYPPPDQAVPPEPEEPSPPPVEGAGE